MMPSHMRCMQRSRHILYRCPVFKVSSFMARPNINCQKYSSVIEAEKPKKTTKYKHTILFPSTPFPSYLKGKKRIENEKYINKIADYNSAYDSQEAQVQEFILHDGPPYANGKLHMGHALNKILKDITVRYKYLKGYNVNFIPGWDCHGLPIELKALERAQENKEASAHWNNMSPQEIRNRARALAEETMEIQRKSFEQWGLFINWNKRYCTTEHSYIVKQIKLFKELYDKGFIFQEYMPVNFSPSSGTSLAESELEYCETHESPSLYLALPVMEDHVKEVLGISPYLPTYLSIWTTTPWTLPANMAVCVDVDKEYSLVATEFESQQIVLVWIKDRVKDLPSILRNQFKVLRDVRGETLRSLKYIHPINGSFCPVIPSPHVSPDKGTGIVHTAPAHGKEDFAAAKQYGIQTDIQLVDDRGCFKSEAGEELRGKHVLEEGNDAVIKIIEENRGLNGASLVLNLDKIIHSYPYDWRTKKPTIVRASKQWFFDVSKVKAAALKGLENVKIYPEKLRKRLVTLVQNRAYWCISRQRVWGVPIPVFYEAGSNKPLINCRFVDHLCSLIEEEGADVWWKYSEEKLLPPEYVKELKNKGIDLPKKGNDILDIWFDSGASWRCVLDGKVADLYLEGHDQTNGWFQSSLLLSVAATGCAPYKQLFMHGFTVDEHLKKMSKSLKNVFDPSFVIHGGKNQKQAPAYGVSVLRWWTLTSSPFNDVPFGLQLLEACENDVQKIRNTFCFMLGSLNNFNPDEKLSLKLLRLNEQYALSTVKPYLEKVWNDFENFEYSRIPSLIRAFLVQEFGNDYINSTKDILYFEPENCLKRKSIQTAIYLVLPYLWKSIAPILPHIAKEVSHYYEKMHENCKPATIPSGMYPPPEWNEFENISSFAEILGVKKAFEERLAEEKIMALDSIKYSLHLTVNNRLEKIFKSFYVSRGLENSDLCALFNVSAVSVESCDSLHKDFTIDITPATGNMCARCRKFAATEIELCPRCDSVIR